MSNEPFVSIIVPTYNRGGVLRECIDSLFNQTYPSNKYEVIVINDGSTDGTESFLKEYSIKKQSLKYYSQQNLGAAAARNLGIEKSIGEILCFIDDDCIADKDWIKSMIGPYSDKNVGGVGGRIITQNTGSFLGRYTEDSCFFNQERLVGIFIVGANSSYRKDVLSAIDGYDMLFRHSEDVDIGIRNMILGYRLEYNPDSVVLHQARLSLKGIMKQVYGYGKGYACLHKKYPDYFNPQKRIIILGLRLIRKMILTPLKVLSLIFVKERRNKLHSSFLDMGLLASELSGVAIEATLGKPYSGIVIRKKLDFISKANMPYGWGT